jgi:hypothetical protein
MRFVLLYNSKIPPWRDDLEAIKGRLAILAERGAECEQKDTAHMTEEDMAYWGYQVMAVAMRRGLAVRQTFGSKRIGMLPYLGKQVPALLAYEAGKNIPVVIYPHRYRRGRTIRDYLITDLLC